MAEPTPPNPGSVMQFPVPPADAMQAQLQAVMQTAMAGGAPRFYANAVGVALTPADIVLTVLWNGVPACIINLAVSTAKGIGEDILAAVKEYERLSEQTVQATGQIGATMQRVRDARASAALEQEG